ncbi:MAG: hypothetical protein ACXWQ5_00355 [Ktedonobacterales bacterium]
MSGKKAREKRKGGGVGTISALWTEDGRKIVPDQKTLDATEKAAQGDRQWFDEHSGAKARLRPPISGEWPTEDEDKVAAVLVRQVRPGVRTRQPLLRGRPFMQMSINPESGEVFDIYTEAETGEDKFATKIADGLAQAWDKQRGS